MDSSKPTMKHLARQQAFEADDDLTGAAQGEYTPGDNETALGSNLNHFSCQRESPFDVKTEENLFVESHVNAYRQTQQVNEKYANSITLEDVVEGKTNFKSDLFTSEKMHNIKTDRTQETAPVEYDGENAMDDQKTTKKYNRVKLALKTTHAGIFVTGDSQDDPSYDPPIVQSFEKCPSWVDSNEATSPYLTPHYQPSTSSNEMEICTVTLQNKKGRPISLNSTGLRQRSNSSPQSRTSGNSVEDSGFEASGRNSDARSRSMSNPPEVQTTDQYQSSGEQLPNSSEEVSLRRNARSRRRKMADFSSYRHGRLDFLSPTYLSKNTESSESCKQPFRFSISSGDSGLDTTKSANSLSPRSTRSRRCLDRSHRRISSQSKLSSKSSIKSDNCKGSFLSFLSPKTFLRRQSDASRNSTASRYSRKRLSDFPEDEKLLVLNVSGQKFKLHDYFTSVYPETLLGNSKRNKYFDNEKGEFFFDRDPDIFRHIWNFYYTGKLHFPKDECVNHFVDEMSFFEVSENHFCTCCWEDEYEPAIEKLEKRRAEAERYENEMQSNVSKIPEGVSLKQKIWLTTKHPVISLHARIFYFFSTLAIVISILANISETIPCSNTINICKEKNLHTYFYIDAGCVAFFTIEYSIRLITAPKRLTFIRQFMSVIDLLAIVPFYCDLLIQVMFGATTGSGMDFLEILRILRIVRVFKLLKHSHRLQALVHTFKSSTKELGLIVVIYLVVITVFASVIYYAEIEGNPNYSSIPESMWYAVITTTTTGYGDIVPGTIAGKLVGCACCLLGVLIVALPVPILQIK